MTTRPPAQTNRCRKPRLTLALLLLAAVTKVSGNEPLTLTFVDATTGEPVADVVVTQAGQEPPKATAAASGLEMAQRDRQFAPHVLTVPQGAAVAFPNRDDTQHHVYSFSPAKTFELELYAGTPEAPVVFGDPGIVELGCNIHDHMQAFIVVTAGGQSYRSGNAGIVRLDAPFDAEQPLRFWHPRLEDNTRLQTLSLEPTGPAQRTIQLRLIPEPPADSSLDLLQQRFRNI